MMEGADTSGVLRILRVAVGSSNPAKVDAVVDALRICLDPRRRSKATDDNSAAATLECEGFSVESGVDCQPLGDEMTSQGAKNRACAAYVAYKKKYGHYPHLSIGMEGGVEWTAANSKDLFCMAWIAIYGKRQPFTVDLFASESTTIYYGDKKPYLGLAKTASFPLPPKLTQMIVHENMELGDADDALFRRTNSKQGSGTVGISTDNIISRAAYYEHAMLLALIPWIRPDLYPPESSSPSSSSSRQQLDPVPNCSPQFW